MIEVPLRSGRALIDPGALTIAIRAGMNSSPWLNKNTPWVVPIGAIQDLDVVEAGFMQRGYVRVVLRDLAGYCPLATSDLGYLSPRDKNVHGLAEELGKLMRLARPMESSGLTSRKWVEPNLGRAAVLPDDTFGSVTIDHRAIFCEGQSVPIGEATAEVVSADAARTRVTATRVVGGAVLFGPLGALVGGMAKKNVGQVFILVTAEDGRVLSGSGRAKDAGKAAELVARINMAR